MSSLYWPSLIADYYRGLEIVTAVVGVIILVSSDHIEDHTAIELFSLISRATKRTQHSKRFSV